MLELLLVLIAQASPVPAPVQASRPPDIAFKVQMVDPGFSEFAAVADFNRDGASRRAAGSSTSSARGVMAMGSAPAI